MPDPRTKPKEIPFNGKLMTSDPATIGANFQTLKNARYTDTHVKMIAGFAKVTTAVVDAANKIVKSAWHFLKSQPFESHIMVQSYNTALTGAGIYDSITTPPTSSAFSTTVAYTQSSGFGLARFSNAPDGQMILCNGVDVCIWGGIESKIGSLISVTEPMTAALSSTVNPEDYTEEIQNTKTDTANVFTCGGSYRTFLIGTPRPARAAYFYVSSPNVTANTLQFYYSTGGAWQLNAVNYDLTRVAGKSFAQSGRIEWGTTVGVCKPRYIDGKYLYWYQIIITDGSANISHITVDMPMQGIVDLWDGTFRSPLRVFRRESGALINITTKVLEEDYYSTDTSTYSDLSSFPAFSDPNNCHEIGFAEKCTAIYFNIPAGYTNSTASTTATISYWTGNNYTTVGTIVDGTSSGGVSFAIPGVISWNSDAYSDEVKKSVSNSSPLYYYRISFNQDPCTLR